MEDEKEIILKPRSEGASTGASTLAERIRTGRRELRALLSHPRATHSAKHGVQRAQAKRPAGISARQWKKLRGKGQPNPGEALACFHAWERASEEERAAGKVKDYAYFSKCGRKDVRAWPVLHAGSHWHKQGKPWWMQ